VALKRATGIERAFGAEERKRLAGMTLTASAAHDRQHHSQQHINAPSRKPRYPRTKQPTSHHPKVSDNDQPANRQVEYTSLPRPE